MVQDVKDICYERCAEYGEIPCYEMHRERRGQGLNIPDWEACADCIADCGAEKGVG